ncbi:site-specific DNA-methyltransferase [Candidatus Peregrinibacteria bacterium CG10_big_fil_rev_8_21_14_0_10_36_19]|nr:MAG: site-specific DNA-methyltransferase [Candidatus Peregrinibacteria bacterium CG10_big_fil_rev_8_21_14_0_10_36_19]
MADNQNTTQNIIAPNNDLEIVKKNFPHCFDKSGDFDFEKFKKELTTSEINFSKESYGMDWLGKSYARLLATDPAKTLIKEDIDWNEKQENKNSENLLIKGDNLEVLKHLSNAYHEKVKMIYIDPPYNTGSDGFVYEDDRKFTVEQFSELAGVDEEQAKKILSFVNSKSNSHSAWLTFMYPRLYIAKQLLKDDGVIFVSIDDNEVAQLRILMDEIFGEENFVGQILWKRKKEISSDSKKIAIQGEYVLCFSKTLKAEINNELLSDEYIKKSYNEPNKIYTKGKWRPVPITVSKGLSGGGYNYSIKTPTGKIHDKLWAYPEYGYKELLEKGLIYFGVDGNAIPQKIIYLHESSGQTISNYWDNVATNKEGKKEILDFFQDINLFDTAKPSKLIKKIISLATTSNDLILDFFAGSGTTGDAVMQLNAEDRANGKEGNRKYILVQLPELIDPKKNKTAYDFVKNELGVDEPTIFEITKERLVRAGKKIDDKSGFKIFETQPIWEDYEFEAKEFDAQTKLFDESKLSSEDLQTLLTTWKTYDNISLTESLKNVDLEGYTGYYGNGRLYLMNKGFETKNLKALLNKIDEDTTFNPISIIVFGYHFRSKVLREIAENVSNYANKKKLDIDFITRY